MIAWVGLECLRPGHRDPRDVAPKPRWPLDSLTAPDGRGRMIEPAARKDDWHEPDRRTSS